MYGALQELSWLDLSNNRIGDSGVESLATALGCYAEIEVEVRACACARTSNLRASRVPPRGSGVRGQRPTMPPIMSPSPPATPPSSFGRGRMLCGPG